MDEPNREKQTKSESFLKTVNNTPDSKPDKPVEIIEMNNIRAAIFEKKRYGKNGKDDTFYQISFSARYLKDGRWRTSHSFRPREIKFRPPELGRGIPQN